MVSDLQSLEMITADEECTFSWMMCRSDRNAVEKKALRWRDE